MDWSIYLLTYKIIAFCKTHWILRSHVTLICLLCGISSILPVESMKKILYCYQNAGYRVVHSGWRLLLTYFEFGMKITPQTQLKNYSILHDCLSKEDWTLERKLLRDFSKLETKSLSKCCHNIICTSWKNNHFLFYAQECGAEIEPATPSWKLNFKWP